VVGYTLAVAGRVVLDSTKGADVPGKGPTTDFPLVEQGYDPNQVDEYLANQMLQLRGQADTAAARVRELEAELAAAKEREDAIQLTMVAATKARDELLAKAREDADEIFANARREAFMTMTEARKDSETTVAEGKQIVEEARREALNIVNEAEEETKRLVAEREAALAKLRTDYEAESATLIDRINTLRAISDDLLAKTVASSRPAAPTAPQPAAPAPAPTAAAAPTPQDPPPPNEGRTASDASQAEDMPDHDTDGDTPIADRIRGSFSGRRSAKLPRIGEEAGRSALAAATAMRAHLSHEPDESESDEGLAVRTA
jgi:cell division septum initiation protein DivIVA